MSAFLWGMTANSDSPLVILVVAAVFFSGDCGTSESGGRGGIIDCGFLYGVVFGAGDVGGSIGSGGLGMCRGGGGCAASVLHLSETWVVLPISLFTVTGFDSVVCLPFVLGCVDSKWVCFVPSCVIVTSSESPVSALRSCVLVVLSAFLDLPAPVWGLPSGRVSVIANLCKICSATVFLLLFVSSIFVCPATFATGLAALVRPSGIFFSGFCVPAGKLDAFSAGFVAPADSLGVPSSLPSMGGHFIMEVDSASDCIVFLILALVRAPMEDNRQSANVMPSSSDFRRCFVDEVFAV